MKPDNEETLDKADEAKSGKAWQPMTLTHIGEAKDVLRGGGGKTSPHPGDPGDTFKPPGQKL